MDALMAAIVLGAICQISDKTPWLAAIFADRFRSPALVVLAAVVALGFNYAIGVAAGLAVTALLTPEARLLLLALALVLAGAGTGFRFKRPDALEGWRTGPAFTSMAGLVIMAFGDRMQFIVAALAGRSTLPWAAMVGAVIGGAAVNVVAVALGEAGWLRLPLKALRIAAAAILLIAGVMIGLNALRLV